MTGVINKSCANCGYSTPRAIFLYFGVWSLLEYLYVCCCCSFPPLQTGIEDSFPEPQ